MFKVSRDTYIVTKKNVSRVRREPYKAIKNKVKEYE